MYLQLGYENFRTVSQYYSGEEDAWGTQGAVVLGRILLYCRSKSADFSCGQISFL